MGLSQLNDFLVCSRFVPSIKNFVEYVYMGQLENNTTANRITKVQKCAIKSMFCLLRSAVCRCLPCGTGRARRRPPTSAELEKYVLSKKLE